MPKPSDLTVATWARLVRAQQSAMSAVEAALKQAGYPPLIWYDVLLELERAGETGLRPFELEGALMLRQYGVSRLVARIEKAGHVIREDCEDDGRGQRLVITATGRDQRRRMWSVYGPAIEKSVGAKLTADQSKTLAEILAKLID